MIMKIQHQIRRIAVAAVAITAVVLMSGCASYLTASEQLDRWNEGENKDLMLVRSVHPINPKLYESECKQGKLAAWRQTAADEQGRLLASISSEICPTINTQLQADGFVKSDFGKGAMIGVGLVPIDMKVEADDIVELSREFDAKGRVIRSNVITRVIRKNALKERDPTCYWDGQSGRFDAFATGGVVCPAEGWDWRDQKWARK
jgi:hypothetical protein